MTPTFHDTIAAIPARQWDALAGPQPFLQHAFLLALETCGCVGGESGWQPLYAVLAADGELIAAMPLFLKDHSWGEYVFDWAWADASERAGLPYYPKLLSAIPFTPVPGPRLLARNEAARQVLLEAVMALVRRSGLSGFHCLFPLASEQACLASAGFLCRSGVQFHWMNRGYRDYTDFLAVLNHDKRKKLRQERRKVADAGVVVQRKSGAEISREDWAFFSLCYQRTYREHRSTPYLNLEFFLSLGEHLAGHCLLVLALRDGQPIAAALNLFDGQRLYGRYWGALEYVPNLHFELCYHQGIEFAIERGLAVFEGGAQGEHKLARGFEAVATQSWHWLANPELMAAVGRFLDREGQGIAHYLHELDERAPFRDPSGA
ncbi:N-acetyltransferase [Chitinimonas arctica]|uniref:N-acetyltransferase n=1 Tax=Chitinimonas arctica TaxID=2594795 RepID=A0A516SL31_9NEIS|nr:GNAT family N-acetyltransferase [Chitinimonas arctica]QDQ28833.1 N-acetyltransferase [Chitinimonas arctica]